MPAQFGMPDDMQQRIDLRVGAIFDAVQSAGVDAYSYRFELDEYGNSVLVFAGERFSGDIDRAYVYYRRLVEAAKSPRFAILATHDEFTRITVAIAR